MSTPTEPVLFEDIRPFEGGNPTPIDMKVQIMPDLQHHFLVVQAGERRIFIGHADAGRRVFIWVDDDETGQNLLQWEEEDYSPHIPAGRRIST